MDETIKNLINRLYPEIGSGYHIPKFAVVTGIPDSPESGGLCDTFRPRFAVDVQILDKTTGEPDETLPPLYNVSVNMATGGDETGFLSLPSVGTKVVVQFINGLPNWPIVTAILPQGLSLSPLKKDGTVWTGGLGAEQSVSPLGDWSRTTPGDIKESCDERTVNAYKNNESYRNSITNIAENANTRIGGDSQQVIAGKATMLSNNDMVLQSAANIRISAANCLELISGKDYKETIKGRRTIQAETLYLGTPENNTVELLYLLIRLVGELTTLLSTHTHIGAPPDNAPEFAEQTTSALCLLKRIESMVPELVDNNMIPTPYCK